MNHHPNNNDNDDDDVAAAPANIAAFWDDNDEAVVAANNNDDDEDHEDDDEDDEDAVVDAATLVEFLDPEVRDRICPEATWQSCWRGCRFPPGSGIELVCALPNTLFTKCEGG